MKIIHIDADAFFASVEQRDAPELKGRPIIVGGSPKSRGVVAASSYEARKYGIYSAMPCATAARLCPQAIFLPPRFDVYKSVSQEMYQIYQQYTDVIETVSLDEAYLEFSDQAIASEIAKKIKQDVLKKVGLT